jgi:hypothetical protein
VTPDTPDTPATVDPPTEPLKVTGSQPMVNAAEPNQERGRSLRESRWRWVLSDSGYVLDFLWHVRGDNKGQGLKPRWNAVKTSTGKRQFPPTQRVVLELVSRMPNEQTCYQSINQSTQSRLPDMYIPRYFKSTLLAEVSYSPCSN